MMRLQTLVVASGLALVSPAVAGPLLAPGQGTPAAGPAQQAVLLLRVVNTVEANRQAGHFDALSAVLQAAAFKERFPVASQSDSATAIVGGRTLVLIVSDDRKHYHAMVTPVKDCGVASFTDESGKIYSGPALGCEK